MNIDNFFPFKDISIKAKNNIKEQSKIIEYNLGQPITMPDIISSNVFIIIEGQARLLSYFDERQSTIAKLGNGSFVGLASILCGNPCEDIRASTIVKGLSISDELILSLYKEEKSFRDFCNQTLFPSELLNLAKILINNSSRTDINLLAAFNSLAKGSKLNTIFEEEKIALRKDQIQFISSSNISGKRIGDIYKDEEMLYTIKDSIFHGRLISISKTLYSNFMELKRNKEVQNNNNNIILTDLNKVENAPIVAKSSLKLDGYSPKKSSDIIRATGDLREAIACLQMIAFDLEVPFRKDSIEKIIRDEIRGNRKATLDTCAGILSMLGLHVSRAKIPAELATRVPCPTLIQWDSSFAVVKESNVNGLTIASPRDGLIEIDSKDLEEKFDNSFELLIIEKSTSTPNKNFDINWFLPALKKYKGVLTQVLLASFIVQLFGLANPLLIQVIIDKVISQRSLDTLQVLGIALVVVTILGGIISSLRTYLFTETTNRIDTKLGSEVIDHLLRLPLKYFDNRPVGELGTRVAELQKIREFLTGQALTTILDALFSLIYILVMVIYSWLLTFIALAVLPIQIGLTLLGSPLLRRQIRQTARENAKTQSHLVEILTGVQTVKAQNVETVSRWKWQSLYGKYISRTFEKTITVTALQQTSQVLQQLSQLLVLWVGASLVLSGKLTLGQLIAFRIISSYVTQPLLRLSSIWQSIQELKVSFERLADIIDTPEESNEADKANIPLPKIKGNVKFDNVSFRFKKDLTRVLKNIELEIPAGKFVGIAGQSGSGKSTLMKLLPRLYEIEKGRILIDNYDISKVELYSLRRQIGIVPQDPLLFSGTITENIALTNPEIAADEIVKAAKIANAHDFIMELPLGYSTNVGERGSGLSGGQRQRIAIARSLLNNPELLILDEATSALDYDTEKKVCDNLKEQCKGSTVFFITHRLSTIKNADTVIMMDQGTISEVGTHQQLMDKQGRYFALYRQQEAT